MQNKNIKKTPSKLQKLTTINKETPQKLTSRAQEVKLIFTRMQGLTGVSLLR